MDSRVMTKAEWEAGLQKFNLTPTRVCDLIYIRTGAIIKPKHIHADLDRYGRFSERCTALFRFVFIDLKERGTNEPNTEKAG